MEETSAAPESPEPPTPDHPWVVRSIVNCFYYLYQDAEWLRGLASSPGLSGSFDRTRCCRTAILLYAFSLEALINKAWDLFLPDRLKPLLPEKSFSLAEKWRLLPLLVTEGPSFDTSRYPWSSFADLIRVRNDLVHPKYGPQPERARYYLVRAHDEFDCLDPDKIPDGVGIRGQDLVYGQLRIPRDPYALLPAHLETVKQVVDDTIAELDHLLGGRIKAGKLLDEDQLELIHPQGATFPIPAPRTKL